MIWLVIPVFLVGATLLAQGLIGHRIGDEPRCRKCRYNLTGVESAKCPECGRPWTIETAVKGLRFKRKRPIAWGLVFLALSAAGLTWRFIPVLNNFNFYPYLPLTAVLSAAERGEFRAIAELDHRLDKRLLSDSQLRQVVDAALRAESRRGPDLQFWIAALHASHVFCAMTPAQQLTYTDRLARFSIRAPRRRRVGEQMPIQFRLDTSAALLGASYSVWDRDIYGWHFARITGRVVIKHAGAQVPEGAEPREWTFKLSDSSVRRVAISNAFHSLLIPGNLLPPGSYEIAAHLQFSLYRESSDAGPTEEAPWIRQVNLTTQVRIDSADAQPTISEIENAALRDRLRERIELRIDTLREYERNPTQHWNLIMRFPLPCALAGGLYLVDGSREMMISEGWQSIGDDYPNHVAQGPLIPNMSPRIVDFIDAAQHSFNLVYRADPKQAELEPSIETILGGGVILASFERSDKYQTGWRSLDRANPTQFEGPPTRRTREWDPWKHSPAER